MDSSPSAQNDMLFFRTLRLAPQNDVFFHLAILSLSVILNLFQDPVEMLKQVQHDKMACSGLTISSLSPQGRGGFPCHSEGFDRRIVLDL